MFKLKASFLELDAISTVKEVLAALRLAIPGKDDAVAKAERDAIGDVRI